MAIDERLERASTCSKSDQKQALELAFLSLGFLVVKSKKDSETMKDNAFSNLISKKTLTYNPKGQFQKSIKAIK